MPVWSAMNSRLLYETIPPPLSRICPVPYQCWIRLLPEYSSLFTLMLEMEKIQRALNGNTVPVLVAADMALYSKLLEMKLALKKDNWIIRLGDFNIVIAMLRWIFVYIEGSGLEEVWSESGVYSASAVRQILCGNHVKRGVDGHSILVSAFLTLEWAPK